MNFDWAFAFLFIGWIDFIAGHRCSVMRLIGPFRPRHFAESVGLGFRPLGADFLRWFGMYLDLNCVYSFAFWWANRFTLRGWYWVVLLNDLAAEPCPCCFCSLGLGLDMFFSTGIPGFAASVLFVDGNVGARPRFFHLLPGVGFRFWSWQSGCALFMFFELLTS